MSISTAPRRAPALGTAAKTTSRRRDIQGLRALAVILVVAFHAGLPVPGGFVGVDIFFVISGFVITATLLRELQSTGRLNFVTFYSRRARRILPALALVVVATAVASTLLLSPLGSQQRTAALGSAASLLAANAALYKAARTTYFSASTTTFPLLHTWSLAVEEQFYIFFPAFLFLVWRLGQRAAARFRPRAVAAVLLGLLALVSFALSLWTTTADSKFAFYGSPTRAWEFAVGAILALVVPELGRLSRAAGATLGIIGLCAVVAAARIIAGTTPFPGTAALLPVAGAAFLIAAGTATSEGGATALLSNRTAVWIGDLSYGWYLWHWPAIVFARALWPRSSMWLLSLVGLMTLLPAWLSARFLENPIRHNRSLTGRRILPLVAKCTLIPVSACGVLYLGARVALTTNVVSNLQAQTRLHADRTRGCDQGRPVGQTPPTCTWSVSGAQGSVVLVGDSNAGQYTEPVAAATARLSLNLTVATAEGCPFVDMLLQAPAPFDPVTCRNFVSESVPAISRLKPNLVIIASSSVEYLNNPLPFRGIDGGSFTLDASSKETLWAQGLASILHQFAAVGIPTLVVHTAPHIEAFDLTLCPAVRVFAATQSCGRTVSRTQVVEQQRLALAAESRAQAEVPQSAAVDFTNDLCTPASCSTNHGNTWVYRDSAHLSIGGALSLTDRFADLVQRYSRK